MTAPLDTAGLVESLRRTPDRNALTQNTCQAQNSLLREAADEIERLSALESRPVALADASPKDTAKDSELAEARAALEPFGKIAEEYADQEDDDFQVWRDFDVLGATLPLRIFRRARTVLSREKEARHD
jgi:vacuolar-type H+-ATPase subunit I/STV1